MNNSKPKWTFCSDGTGEVELGSKILFITFDHYIDLDSFDGHGYFKNIEIYNIKGEWGTPDGDLIEAKLNKRNQTRIREMIEDAIYSDFEAWGCDDVEWDRSDEPNDLNTLYSGCY